MSDNDTLTSDNDGDCRVLVFDRATNNDLTATEATDASLDPVPRHSILFNPSFTPLLPHNPACDVSNPHTEAPQLDAPPSKSVKQRMGTHTPTSLLNGPISNDISPVAQIPETKPLPPIPRNILHPLPHRVHLLPKKPPEGVAKMPIETPFRRINKPLTRSNSEDDLVSDKYDGILFNFPLSDVMMNNSELLFQAHADLARFQAVIDTQIIRLGYFERLRCMATIEQESNSRLD
ncbi:hypothetical protein BJX64DRAFT_285781 [Aspergillus heterothallicus]